MVQKQHTQGKNQQDRAQEETEIQVSIAIPTIEPRRDVSCEIHVAPSALKRSLDPESPTIDGSARCVMISQSMSIPFLTGESEMLVAVE